jgi:ribosome-binding factor A
MKKTRIARLNSLLREVIAEVIIKEVRDPKVNKFTSITSVDASEDLRHANVFVSVIGSESEKEQTLATLQSAAGYIATQASHLVKLRYFPSLSFKLDDSVEKHLRIEKILQDLKEQDK